MKASLFVLYGVVLGFALGATALADTADGRWAVAQASDDESGDTKSDSNEDPECE